MGMLFHHSSFLACLLFVTCFLYLYPGIVAAKTGGTSITRHYKFDVQMQNVTRLCETKSIITVNGKFPGPRIIAREGDRVIIKVVNHVSNNITIHWHGIRQLQSGWADGPAYITQCPIQTGQSYVYNFTITGQRGTLWYHAHVSWIRATLYGPIIILPKVNDTYPFVKPYKGVPIIFGEWWNVDPEAVLSQAVLTGAGPNNSDTYTINGFPGPSKNCSANELYRLKFNLVDPLERNTVGVPSGGWVAIRFRADNPGVWFMHCHIEIHLTWGLRMAWVVKDGKLPNQKLPPPPADLPRFGYYKTVEEASKAYTAKKQEFQARLLAPLRSKSNGESSTQASQEADLYSTEGEEKETHLSGRVVSGQYEIQNSKVVHWKKGDRWVHMSTLVYVILKKKKLRDPKEEEAS
ncbi:hypothetical protein L1887_12441 [Cichorium endivia]|nr:hypothetical protein L1887_12441 [Cichorium endivia]